MLIKKLHLLSDDLLETEKFYHHTLGLSLQDRTDQVVTFVVGETELSFHQSFHQKPQYHFAFTIPCNQIKEAQVWMKGKAPLLIIKPNEPIADFSNWNAKAFYFLDNNGNILEFIARNDLHNDRSEPFSNQHLLAVSEIGIVVDDVSTACEQLKRQFQVDYFDKQPPLPRFAAMGDDHGLFIVVPHSREWYPTDILSSKHWMKIDFEVGENQETLMF